MDRDTLPPNIQAKATKYDPELILENELIKKYSDRYKQYRKDYFTMLRISKYKQLI